jgi:cytochrome P450
MESPPVALPTHRHDPLDPPEELALFRETEPVRRLAYPDGHVGWLVTSHELARAVLGDNRFTMVDHDRTPILDARSAAFARLRAENAPILRSSYAGNFLRMDPPRHTQLRHALTAEFTVRRMEELRPHIRQIVDARLDLMERVGPPADLVEMVALPMPSMAICELLGVPYEEHEAFDRYSKATEDPASSPDDIASAYHAFGDLIFRVIAAQKEHPGDGLIGRLVSRGELTDDEIAGVGRLLVAAGHHTVRNMLALSVFALLVERSRWQALAADRAVMPNAVEELLRYLTTFKIGAFTRTASVDVEVGGVLVRAGESVTVSLSAANRDRERFHDPDVLDLAREGTSGHLAFGYGIHMCLGQHLARVELQVGLDRLLVRFPSLRLAVPADEIVMHPDDLGQAGPNTLPVAW